MTQHEAAAAALVRFDQAWATLDKTIQGAGDRALQDVRDPAGWSAKDHLMHVATWEQALLAKLDGRPRHVALGLPASTDGSEDWDALNAQIFAATRDRSLRDVLDTLRATHATTRAHIAALAEDEASARRAEAFLADVPSYAEHYEQHSGWIRALLSSA